VKVLEDYRPIDYRVRLYYSELVLMFLCWTSEHLRGEVRVYRCYLQQYTVVLYCVIFRTGIIPKYCIGAVVLYNFGNYDVV